MDSSQHTNQDYAAKIRSYLPGSVVAVLWNGVCEYFVILYYFFLGFEAFPSGDSIPH